MWMKIKEERRKPNLNEILKMVIKKKREDAKRIAMGLKPKKEKKKKILEEEVLDPLEQKAKDVHKDIVGINMKILEAGNEIDAIEKRLIDLQKETTEERERKELDKKKISKVLSGRLQDSLRSKLGLGSLVSGVS